MSSKQASHEEPRRLVLETQVSLPAKYSRAVSTHLVDDRVPELHPKLRTSTPTLAFDGVPSVSLSPHTLPPDALESPKDAATKYRDTKRPVSDNLGMHSRATAKKLAKLGKQQPVVKPTKLEKLQSASPCQQTSLAEPCPAVVLASCEEQRHTMPQPVVEPPVDAPVLQPKRRPVNPYRTLDDVPSVVPIPLVDDCAPELHPKQRSANPFRTFDDVPSVTVHKQTKLEELLSEYEKPSDNAPRSYEELSASIDKACAEDQEEEDQWGTHLASLVTGLWRGVAVESERREARSLLSAGE